MKMPFYQLEHTQDVIRHFTPNWFTVIMGTGIVALILAEFPFFETSLFSLASLLWQLNTLLFVIFSVLYTLRWILYPHEAQQIFKHPSMSLFLGAIPMALATIINGFLKFGVEMFGEFAVQIAMWLWYVDVILAVVIAWGVPLCMYHAQQHSLKSMSALWLLPIVACEVAASTGGVLVAHLAVGQHATIILLFSYILWGMSIFPAFAILAILMLRLAIHQLPPKELAMSHWLTLGPIGTGALALLVLGEQAPRILAFWGMQGLGETLFNIGIAASLILFGFGLWWIGIALYTTLKHVETGLSFNLGWWALTFPLGVFTCAILKFAQHIPLAFIQVIAYIFASILLMLWLMVAYKTIQGFYQGRLLFSPCLKVYLDK